jgi:gamma-glutamylcyclotransferase (GGCT)/AIG2-like uncharacterized protein YtfP
MRGYALHRVLERASTFVGEGLVRGCLLDLGSYPGLVEGAGRVRGEIYRIDDPELLAVLDRAEGYNFDRRRTTVTLAKGRRMRAWIYRYRGRRERAVLIPDGDYRRAPRRPAGRGAPQKRRTQWR